jgi:xanthine dehydrogenase YagR molybdenum-binding subunit
MDTNTPVYMRAPGTATGVFALETAMDELAVRLGKDPIELRLRNYAQRDPSEGKPWSSNELRTCYRVGAERFGWSRRSAEPRSMRDGDWLVGHGMATTIYPAYRSEASASATLLADGTAVVRSATADMGPGTWTSMTQVAADALGLPIAKVRFELGDSDFPNAPEQGGSMTMASVGNAVRAACEAVRARAGAFGAQLPVTATVKSKPGAESERYSSYAFGAVFAEVRVDAELGLIRVPRLVGAYDIGRVVNPKLARSQAIGGMVGGVGMALLERADWDRRFGRVMNANFAEYLVPVNADIGALDVTFVPGDDRRFNPLGVKGVAELSLCGVAAAIGNAIYHATGVRLRELPFTLDRLL